MIINSLQSFVDENNIGKDAITQTEIEIKYTGYITKEKLAASKLIKLEKISIPENFDYSKLNSISSEAREKFNEIKPKTIGQASRISGVSPADINILLIYIGR